MIQTTKDADKAKTSQRQRVDDQNDRFVSRNCHHAPHRSHCFGRYSSLFFNGFPDLLRDAQPGTRKRTSSVQHRDLVTVFSYLTLLTKSIQPSSYGLMI